MIENTSIPGYSTFTTTVDLDPDQTRNGHDQTRNAQRSNQQSTISLSQSNSWQNIFKTHRSQTVAYCCSFMSFGMCVGFLGPTLSDLSCQASTSMQKMNLLFLMQSSMTLVGSFLAVPLLKWVPAHVVLLIGVFMLSIAFLIMSFITATVSMFIIMLTMGLAMGIIDTTSTNCVLEIYGKTVAPMMMTMHLLYAVGALLAPVVTRPFLFDLDCEKYATYIRQNGSETLMDIFHYLEDKVEMKAGFPNSFYILASVQVPAIVLLLWLILRGNTLTPSTPNNDYCSINGNSSKQITNNRIQMLLLGLSCSLLAGSDGIQAVFADYTSEYTMSFMDPALVDRDTKAANFLVAFWGGFVAGRFAAIFVSVRFSPTTLLFFDVIGFLVSILAMSFCSSSYYILLVSIVGCGLFLSSVTPSLYSVSEQVTALSPFTTCLLVVSAAGGETMFPLVTGQLMPMTGSSIFPTISGACIVTMAVVLIVFAYYAARNHEHTALCELKKSQCPAPFKLKNV